MSSPDLRQFARRIRSAPTLRVFLTLPDILSWTEWRWLDQQALAEELETDRATISRALSELVGLKLLKRHVGPPADYQGTPIPRNAVVWKLSLDTSWRGSVRNYWTEAGRQGKAPPGQPHVAAEAISRNQATKPAAAGTTRQRALPILRDVTKAKPRHPAP